MEEISLSMVTELGPDELFPWTLPARRLVCSLDRRRAMTKSRFTQERDVEGFGREDHQVEKGSGGVGDGRCPTRRSMSILRRQLNAD
jgi:hypothetical protein